MASERRGSLDSALRKRRHDEHDDEDFIVIYMILPYELKVSVRNTREMFYRNEGFLKTNNFLPFISYCEL